MFKLAVAFLLVFLAISTPPFEAHKTHKDCFYKKSQCPRFTLVKKTANYEERDYDGAWWVSVSTKVPPGVAITRNISLPCYKHLRRYLKYSGVSMGVPVTTTVKPNLFTMSFFLPKANPPTPTSTSRVRLEYKKQFSVYVKVYTILHKRINKFHAQELNQELKNDNRNGTYYTPDQMYMTAGYDPPWIRNNTKEVWLVKHK